MQKQQNPIDTEAIKPFLQTAYERIKKYGNKDSSIGVLILQDQESQIENIVTKFGKFGEIRKFTIVPSMNKDSYIQNKIDYLRNEFKDERFLWIIDDGLLDLILIEEDGYQIALKILFQLQRILKLTGIVQFISCGEPLRRLNHLTRKCFSWETTFRRLQIQNPIDKHMYGNPSKNNQNSAFPFYYIYQCGLLKKNNAQEQDSDYKNTMELLNIQNSIEKQNYPQLFKLNDHTPKQIFRGVDILLQRNQLEQAVSIDQNQIDRSFQELSESLTAEKKISLDFEIKTENQKLISLFNDIYDCQYITAYLKQLGLQDIDKLMFIIDKK